MAFITKDVARIAARARIQKSYGSSANQVLQEEILNSTRLLSFDIFLSHSFEDSEIVLGVREILVGLGLTVYIDWINDTQLSRENVTVESADILRRRMRESRSLVYLTTKNSSTSRWMPWELGYFDGLKSGLIGILPVIDTGATFSGQEYLGLYPVVERLQMTNGSTKLCVVEKANKGYRFLDEFARGQTSIHAFSS